MDGRQGDEFVAVGDYPVPIDGEHTVAVPVEREADVIVAARGSLDDRVQMGRAASVVDVAPVRLFGQHLDLGAQSPEDFRSRTESCPVGAVEQHPAPAQVELAETDMEFTQVVLQRPVKAPPAPNPLGPVETPLALPFDRTLGRAVDLDAVRGAQL